MIHTFSSIRTFQTCPKLFYFKYILGYKSISIAPSLSFGSAFHQWKEAWHKNIPEPSIELEDSQEAIKLRALIEGYKVRWPDRNIVDTKYSEHEKTFSFNLDKYKISGKIDSVYYDLNSFPPRINAIPVETKTSSDDVSPGSVYWQKLQIDMQIGLYAIALESFGYRIPYILYDVSCKTRLRQKQKETEDEYFNRICNDIGENPDKHYQRGKVYLSSDNLAAIKKDVLDTVLLIDSTSADNYYRCTGNCFKYNRACDFFPVCTGETNLENRERYCKKTSIHEELEDNKNE